MAFEGENKFMYTLPNGLRVPVPASLYGNQIGTGPQPVTGESPALPPAAIEMAPEYRDIEMPPENVGGGAPGLSLSTFVPSLPATSVTGGSLAGPAPVAPAPAAPDLPPVVSSAVEPPAPKPAPKGKVVKAAGAAPAQAGLPLTPVPGATEHQRNVEAGIAAVEEDVRIKAEGAAKIADAKAKIETDLDKNLAARAKAAQEDLEEGNALRAKYAAQQKEIANTKIDRSIEHPIIAAISIVLAGIGSAMKGDKENPAIEMLYRTLDRKVAGQMQDLELKGKIAGMTKEQIQQLKDMPRTAAYDILLAGAKEKAAAHIDTVTAASNSESIKAQGPVLAARMRTEASSNAMDAAQKEREFNQRGKIAADQHKASLYATAAHAKTARERLDFDRAALVVNDKAIGDAAAKGRGAEALKARQEKAKENSERGISNVLTREPLLKEEGRKMMAEADALEAKAKQFTSKTISTPQDIANAEMYKQKAAELRDEARVQYQVLAKNPVEASRLGEHYAKVYSVTQTARELQDLYNDKGRAYISTDARNAAIASKYAEILLQLKEIYKLGVLNAPDIGPLQATMGKEPTSGWTLGNLSAAIGVKLGEDPEAFKGAMDSTIANVQRDTENKIVGQTDYNVKGEALFPSYKPVPESAEDKARRDVLKAQSPREIDEKSISKTEKNILSKSEILQKTIEEKGLDHPDTRKAAADLEPFTSPLLMGPAYKDINEVSRKLSEGENAGDVATVSLKLSSLPFGKERPSESSVKYPGLALSQEAPVDLLLKSASTGNDKALDNLAILATKSYNPEAVMNALRNNASESVFNMVVSRLPENSPARSAAAIQTPTIKTRALQTMDPDTLGQAAIDDPEARSVLITRATKEGASQEDKAALVKVLEARRLNKGR